MDLGIWVASIASNPGRLRLMKRDSGKGGVGADIQGCRGSASKDLLAICQNFTAA